MSNIQKATPQSQQAALSIRVSPSSGNLGKMLSTNADNIRQMLPDHVSLDEFARVAMNAAIQNPMLAQADMSSLFLAASKCAQDGLMPDGREAVLTPFKNGRSGKVEVTYIPMIQGVIKRVLQSGDVLMLGSSIVYEGDEIEIYHEHGEDHVRHKPMLSRGPKDKSKMVLCYAFAKLKGGQVMYEWMNEHMINEVRKASRTADSKFGPWVNHEGQMWRKTVLHRLARRLPLSQPSLQAINRVHDHYDFDQHGPQYVQPVEHIPSADESLRALGVSDEEHEASDNLSEHDPDFIDLDAEY